VLNVPAGSIFKEITALEQLFDMTDSMSFWIRSSTSSTDAIFNSANIPVGSTTNSNGWTLVREAQDLSSTTIGPYFQFCVTYQTLTYTAQTPAQLQDVYYAAVLPGEIADNWTEMNERTSQSGTSPMVVSVRQMKAYTAAPTKFTLKGYDDNGNVVITLDTASNPTAFQVSNNNGTSYSSWVSMSNFMSSFNTALTTELKVTITTPPAVSYITWSFLDA
jgi:hypothetical protein